MPLLILTYVVQIAMIVHVLRTGRNTYWVIILLIAPFGVGALAYFIVELLPDLMSSRHTKSAVRGVRKTLNPGADLRQRQREHRLSGSVDATRHLAGELLDSGRYDEAIEHYRKALTGLYEFDPDLMLGLAQAQFAAGDSAATRETLEQLIDKNPDYRSPDGHLLYARAVEACGDDATAESEYEAVAGSYAGAEARLRYGLLLERIGRPEAAREQFEEIITAAELAPRHYRKAQRDWIKQAKEGLSRVSG